MGIFDRLFAASTKPPEPPLKEPRGGEMGVDGTAYVELDAGGLDVNPAWNGRHKYDILAEMRASDPAIRSVLLMFKLPIAAASWSIEPASDDPQDLLIARAVEMQFGLHPRFPGWLNVSWEESLQMCLQYLDWGAWFEEIVWDKQTFEWTPVPEGEDDPVPTAPVRIRPIRKLGGRHPATITEITTSADGSIGYIEQDLDGAKRIPGQNIVWYVNDREDNGWWGVSMLRSAWGPWRLKKALQIAAGIGFDRFSSGVPLVRYPAGGGPSAERRANQIGANYRTHERGWIALPGAPPPQGDWSVEILSGNGSLADPVPLLRHFDEQIATSALQGFTRLGVTETGSRAVGEVLADPYYLAVESVARYVKTQRERLLIDRFVRLNFGEDAQIPRLVVSRIAADNITQVVEAIANLGGVGWNLSDRDLQNLVRVRLGLPELADDEPLTREGEGLSGPQAAAIPGTEADIQGEEPPQEEE